jgi:hypothetical protein
MLTGKEIRDFRELRLLSLRDVEKALKANSKDDKSLSAQFIGQVETGAKAMNEENYRLIIKGINLAFAEKCKKQLENNKADTEVKPDEEVKDNG